MKFIIAVFTVFLQVSQALGSVQGRYCDTAARAAADTHGVPIQVMLAITRVETGRDNDGELWPWPWAVNRAGQSHWFDSHDEAVAFVQDAVTAGQSNIDIGCFQLNLHWHGEAFASIEAMFDPDKNADYAARFLVHNHAETGNWVDAVARYHSATPVHAAAYVERVEKVLARLGNTEPLRVSSVEASGGSDDLPDTPNRYPLLQPGSQAGLASLVPAGAGLPPLFMTTP
jgi:hypothetical protein